MKFIDLTGQKFDRLKVEKREQNTADGKARWLCTCDCGNSLTVTGKDLRSGNTRSCGCIHKELLSKRSKTHGKSNTRLYHEWQGIKDRCYNPNCFQYDDWGGRGITVCDEWKNNFQAFYDWAMSHGYADNLTIDRIDTNKGYSPENCRWATYKEQNNNKRNNRLITYNGKTQTLKQWADELGINYQTLVARINRYKWNIEKALNTP